MSESRRRALLDVNVLIALLDPDHVHHRLATDWLAQHRRWGWASCPITQNGCIRIMAQPTYPNGAPPGVIAARLREAMRAATHEFWPDDLNLVATPGLDWQRLLSARHLTDAYLLALAVHRQGRLVTLDRGIPLAAVTDAAADAMLILG